VEGSRLIRQTITQGEQRIQNIDVPPGTAYLAVKLDSVGSCTADLDLFIFDRTQQPAATAGADTRPGCDGFSLIEAPRAGQYQISVGGFNVRQPVTIEMTYELIPANRIH
jgi:hypothetical protein